MKRRLVQEGLIYCILPVIAIGGFYNQYRGIPWMILGVGFLYNFYIKRREDRINYTFLTFLILFNTYYIMTNNIKGDILIQFNLGFVIFISIAILLLEAMDFSICKIAFQDILMMLGESKMGVYKVSKKSKVDLNLSPPQKERSNAARDRYRYKQLCNRPESFSASGSGCDPAGRNA